MLQPNQLDSSISFRALTEKDLPILYKWFSDPLIIYWWPTPKPEEKFFEHFLNRIRTKDTVPFLAFIADVPVGYFQYYSPEKYADPEKKIWMPKLPANIIGIDLLIGEPDYRGKGYGAPMIKKFIKYIKQLDPKIDTIIIDPDPSNVAAIKVYEKAGFKRIGEYQAPWGPALLLRYDIN